MLEMDKRTRFYSSGRTGFLSQIDSCLQRTRDELNARHPAKLAGDDSLLTGATVPRQADTDPARRCEILELSTGGARIGFWEVDLDGSRLT
jgi:hypothetical protein